MAVHAARASQREAAIETLVVLGFVYPDALDIRFSLPSGHSHDPVRGTASQPSSALPQLPSDPGPEHEPSADPLPTQSLGADAGPAGGAS